MCIIIDADVAHLLSPLSDDARQVVDWIERGSGRLVIGGQNTRELLRNAAAAGWVRTLLQAGRARRLPEDVLVAERQNVEQLGLCCSNDLHIIALARASGARIVFSQDKKLHTDFTNGALINRPRGKVYQAVNHRHLLRSDACRR